MYAKRLRVLILVLVLVLFFSGGEGGSNNDTEAGGEGRREDSYSSRLSRSSRSSGKCEQRFALGLLASKGKKIK